MRINRLDRARASTVKRRQNRHRRLRFEHCEPRQMMSATPLDNQALVNTETTDDQLTFEVGQSVAGAADGSHVVTWASDRQDGDGLGIFAQRFDPSGQAVGGEFQVNTTTSDDQNYSSVAMDDNGNFVIVWESDDSNRRGIFGQVYDSTGQAIGSEFQANATTNKDQLRPAVTYLNDGTFVVAWEGKGPADGRGVFGRRFSATGSALTGEFRVNQIRSGRQDQVSLAATSDGGFVAVWGSQDNKTRGIYGRLFDANGSAHGGQFLVNESIAGDQVLGAVATDDAGNIVFAWQTEDDGSGAGIFGRIYDAAGVPQTGEFQVNQTVAGDQDSPSVTFDATGAVVFAWHGNGNGDSAGIFIRRFSTSGVALEDEQLANNETSGSQQQATIAQAGDTLVAAWSGAGPEDSSGVYSRRFGFTGNVAGNLWDDADGDGIRDAGENGLDAWTVYVDENANDQLDAGEISAVTDSAGDYTLLNVAPGTYDINVVAPTRWQQTSPTGGSSSVWVSAGEVLYEYDSTGTTLLSTMAIPMPPGEGTGYSARDIVVDGGMVYVYNGTFSPSLSVYDGNTWQHYTHAGWSTVNNVSYGGIAKSGDYVFVTDMYTSGGAPEGIVRFDFSSGVTSVRFADTEEYIDLTIGDDGQLYALQYDQRSVDVFDPETMQQITSITLNNQVRAVTVATNGEIYGASWDDNLYHFASDGSLLNFADSLLSDLVDINIAGDTLYFGERNGDVGITDLSFSNIQTFVVTTQFDQTFVHPTLGGPVTHEVTVVAGQTATDVDYGFQYVGGQALSSLPMEMKSASISAAEEGESLAGFSDELAAQTGATLATVEVNGSEDWVSPTSSESDSLDSELVDAVLEDLDELFAPELLIV